MKNLLYGLLLVLMISCLASELNPLEKSKSITPTEIKGEVNLSDGTSLKLEANDERPLLLIFAQETCEVCRAETVAFKAEYDKLAAKDLRIVTVLVGSIRDDAADWKSSANWEDKLEVPWNVGFEQKADLFTKLCPNSGTPCSLLQVPKKGVVLKYSGLLHPQEVIDLIESEEN